MHVVLADIRTAYQLTFERNLHPQQKFLEAAHEVVAHYGEKEAYRLFRQCTAARAANPEGTTEQWIDTVRGMRTISKR